MRRISLISIAFILLVAIGFIYGLQLDIDMRSMLYNDFGKFYLTLQFAAQHKSLYIPIRFLSSLPEGMVAKLTPTWQTFAPDLNPPFFSFLISPFGWMPYKVSLIAWALFSLLCGIASILLVVKTLFPNISKNLPILFALVAAFFVYHPCLINIQYGQVGFLLGLLVALAWWATRTHKMALAAILLAILTQIKPFFGLFAIYFLCQKQWRTFFIYTLSCVIILSFSLVYYGINVHLDYYATLQQVNWYSSNWNASLLGWFLRLFGSKNEATPPIINFPHAAIWLYWLFSLGLLVLFIKFIRANQHLSQTKKLDLDFSFTLIASLLISPFGWYYYFPILLIPIACLFYYVKDSVSPLSLLLLTVIAVTVLNIPVPLVPPKMIKDALAVFLWSSLYTAALVLLLAGLFIAAKNIKSVKLPTTLPDTPVLFSLATISLLPSLVGMLFAGLELSQHPTDYVLVILQFITGP